MTSNRFPTWGVDADGDFTIRCELWRNHAWIRFNRLLANEDKEN